MAIEEWLELAKKAYDEEHKKDEATLKGVMGHMTVWELMHELSEMDPDAVVRYNVKVDFMTLEEFAASKENLDEELSLHSIEFSGKEVEFNIEY